MKVLVKKPSGDTRTEDFLLLSNYGNDSKSRMRFEDIFISNIIGYQHFGTPVDIVKREDGLNFYGTGAPRFYHNKLFTEDAYQAWKKIFSEAQQALDLENYCRTEGGAPITHFVFIEMMNESKKAIDGIEDPMERARAWIKARNKILNRQLHGSIAIATAKKRTKTRNKINLGADMGSYVVPLNVFCDKRVRKDTARRGEKTLSTSVELPLVIMTPNRADNIDITLKGVALFYVNSKGVIDKGRVLTKDWPRYLSSEQVTAAKDAIIKIGKNELRQAGYKKISR